LKVSISQNNKNNQDNSFEHIYGLYKDALYTFIANELNNEEAAKDLFQDVSIKIYKNIEKANKENIKAWCFKIAVNTIHDYRRKSNRLLRIFKMLNGNEEDRTNETIHEQIYNENDFVQKIISNLPSEQKEIINMHYILGLSYREISEILECSINTVTARARYGLSKLRKTLEMKDYDPTYSK